MTVSPASSTSSDNDVWQTLRKQRNQDFKALQSALQSGDLSGAQQAFSNFQQDAQSSSPAGKKTQNTQAVADFQSLQSALQSGDLNAAQKAFASWQHDLQSARQTHHHHHHHKSEPAVDGTSASTTASVLPTGGSLLDQQA